jgi:pyruvate dehydrogenase E2 component (dihydrolipoamide acetyltransferase)
MSGMRKAIARNLTLSKTTIPHWYMRARVNAGPMMSFYKSQKAKVGCSVNDVIVMACAKAIMEFPAMHSRVDGETILEFPGANIGVAVGMDEGLVVPVILNAEKFTLEQLAVETKRLANQARAGKIENMGQGIFTISNLGMFGVDDFVAIVNPPEAAILAVGAVREDIIVKDGAIKAGQTVNLTLSADHRLIDGTLGAQFMARLKALLEDPIQLIA